MRSKFAWIGLSLFSLLGVAAFTACGTPTDSEVGSAYPFTGKQCATPGDTAEAADGCNDCTCGSDGKWSCTDVACPSGAGGAARGAACTPGAAKNVDCNTCECLEDGTWACTDQSCSQGGKGAGGSGGAAPSTGGSGGTPPACPDVNVEPLPDEDRMDSGKLGLAALREKVLSSRVQFDAYKAQHGNTYTYTQRTSSWTGSYCETTVEVTKGEVTKATERRGAEGAEIETRITAGADGGSDGCHPAITMDAHYEECLIETLCQDPNDNYLYVAIDARGLLIQCGYFPMNCADDCYKGLERTILTTDRTD